MKGDGDVSGNGLWEQMTSEAMEEIAKGGVGWRALPTNILVMAAFGMMKADLSKSIARPLWVAAGAIGTGVVGYLVSLVLEHGAEIVERVSNIG